MSKETCKVEPMGVVLPDDTREVVLAMAHEQNRSVSHIIRELVTKALTGGAKGEKRMKAFLLSAICESQTILDRVVQAEDVKQATKKFYDEFLSYPYIKEKLEKVRNEGIPVEVFVVELKHHATVKFQKETMKEVSE